MTEAITEVRPHDQALLIAVLKRSLDDPSTRQLTDDVLTEAATRPGVPIVLDMSRVRFAPSVALGMLVQLTKSFKLDNRRFALIGVTPQVLGPLRVTNLHTIVEIRDTLEQVLG